MSSAGRDSKTRAESDWRLLCRVYAQAKPHRRLILGVLVLGLLGAPLSLLAPLPLKIAVDCGIQGHPLPAPLHAIAPDLFLHGGTAVIAAATALLVLHVLLTQTHNFLVSVLQALAGERLLSDFRARVFGHCQRLSLAYHDARGTSQAIYSIQYDAASIRTLAIESFGPLVTSTAVLNCVRPVAWITPGRPRAAAAIAAIRPASTPWSSTIVADAGSVARYALSASRCITAHAQSTAPNFVRLTASAITISRNRDQLARRSRRNLTVSRLIRTPSSRPRRCGRR